MMTCLYYDAPTYFFFAPDIPGLLYYSHFPVMFLALLVGGFVFFHNPKALLNRLLFLIALCFAFVTIFNLITWTNVDSGVVLFAWSMFGVLFGLISILSIYFIHVFLYKTDISNLTKIIFIVLMLPVLLLGATDMNVSGFNLIDCDAFLYEGDLYSNYYTALGGLAILWIGVLLVKEYIAAKAQRRQQILLMGIGIEAFLLMFFTIFYLADYLTTFNFVNDSRLELYGFFGMGIFMAMMGVQIVKFKTFNVGAHAAEALTAAIVILVASQYTFSTSNLSTMLTTVTLLLSVVAGYNLIKSVRREVEQRKEIEQLAKKLEKANKRLKVLDQLKSEFVSIASHQLRSPLTSIRGYASMLLEESYGKLSEKAKDAVERIAESSRMMALSVEDYLNVSRIQAGNMKYSYSDFNLADMASGIVDDIRRDAMKRGLVLSYKSEMNKKGVVHADNGKTMQILHNLINNAVKYTPKGTVTVFAHDKGKKIFVDVIDSGIGMTPETIENIFAKFERAKNANEVNVTGTGLGLYVAQKMAQEMGGDIEAFSDGEAKGSTFRLTLPLQM